MIDNSTSSILLVASPSTPLDITISAGSDIAIQLARGWNTEITIREPTDGTIVPAPSDPIGQDVTVEPPVQSPVNLRIINSAGVTLYLS